MKSPRVDGIRALRRARRLALACALLLAACGGDSETTGAADSSVLSETEPVATLEVELASSEGTAVGFEEPELPDGWSSDSTMECVPPSGAIFSVGTTVVDCQATEPDGRTDKSRIEIHIEDTRPPTIRQTDLNVAAETREGATVTFSPKVKDKGDPHPDLSCAPESGSLFPVGVSVVSCLASDRAGNRSGHEFEVVVEPFEARCGNGLVDVAGEECDLGGALGSCCTKQCTLAPSTKKCRRNAGVCDVVEYCNGFDAACPVDTYLPPDRECRGSKPGYCYAGTCSGEAAECPIVRATCGNGFVDELCGEVCDGETDEACPGACQSDCTCDVAANCEDPIVSPEPEGPSGLTCRDDLDNDCDGSVDAEDPDCGAPTLAVQCSLPTRHDFRKQFCVGKHDVEYEVVGAGPDAVVSAELIALGAAGEFLESIPVGRGDHLVLANLIRPKPRINSKGRVHIVNAAVTLLRVSVDDGERSAQAFCSNAPYLEISEPSGSTLSASPGEPTAVLVALPGVDPASLTFSLDGVEIFSALDIDPATDFPGGPYNGEVSVGGVSVSISGLSVEGAPQGKSGSNTLEMVLDGLSDGSHLLSAAGEPRDGAPHRNPHEACHVDDLADEVGVATLGIEIESPLPGAVLPSGPTQVRASIRHGMPIERVFINGYAQDVSSQRLIPGRAGISADQYVLELDTTVELTDIARAIEGSRPDELSFDPGSNRLIIRVVDLLGNQTIERETFAVGEVTPVIDPGEPNASFADEVENAVTVGIDGVTFAEAFQAFCDEIAPDVEDLLQSQAEVSQDDFLLARGLPLDLSLPGYCEPLIEAKLNKKEVQVGGEIRFDPDIRVDGLGCFSDFSSGELRLTINPRARLGYSARGECGICTELGAGLEVTVAVDLDIALRFAQVRATLRDWENTQPIDPEDPAYPRFLADSLSTQAIGQLEIVESSVVAIADNALSTQISQAVLDLVDGNAAWEAQLRAGLDPVNFISTRLQEFIGTWASEFARGKVDEALENKFCDGGIEPGASCDGDNNCKGRKARREGDADIADGLCLPELGVCDGGPMIGMPCAGICDDTGECEPSAMCDGVAQCVPAVQVCEGGSDVGNSCEFSSGCADTDADPDTGEGADPGRCVPVTECAGGSADGLACVDDSGCTGGGQCVVAGESVLIDRVQDQFDLDSFVTDFGGMAVTIKGKFGPSLVDPEIETTPGGLRTPADAPSVPGAGGRSYIAISDDAINQVLASLTAFGEYQSEGCFPAPADSSAPATVGDFVTSCGSGPSDVGTGACVGIRGGDCEALALPSDQGACHAAQGDDCDSIPLSTFILERAAEVTACQNSPIRNITAEMPLLYCTRTDVPPSFWIRDDIDVDGTPISTPDTIETHFRLNDLFVGLVVDREGSESASLPGAKGCAESTSDPNENCLLSATCLDLSFPTNFSLDTSQRDYEVSVELAGVQRLDRADSAVCAGAVDLGNNDPLGLTARFEAVTDDVLETANASWPPLAQALTLPNAFRVKGIDDPRLLAIRTSQAQTGFDDYIAVTTRIPGDLCGNRICDSGIAGEEVCGLSGEGRCVVDCGLCRLREACEFGSDCKSDLCEAGTCRANVLDSGSRGCESECLFGVDCLTGICNFGFCSNPLPALSACSADEACLSGSCRGLICQQVCGDSQCDGTERCGGTNAGLQCTDDCGLCSLSQVCGADSDCASNLCNLGFCQTPRSNGSVCTRDELCQSGNCNFGICRPADCRVVGASCSVNGDCCRGSCTDDLFGGGRSCRLL